MRLYFCRLREDPSTYLGRLLITREGYIPTTDLDEVIFSSDREGMEAVAHKYPEFEVCCLDAEPVCISSMVVTDDNKSSVSRMNLFG